MHFRFGNRGGKQINKKGTGKIKHYTNHYPKRKRTIYIKCGNVVGTFVEEIIRKNQNNDRFNANRNGINQYCIICH